MPSFTLKADFSTRNVFRARSVNLLFVFINEFMLGIHTRGKCGVKNVECVYTLCIILYIDEHAQNESTKLFCICAERQK